MNAPNVTEQPTALPAVACSDLLHRAMNPKEGDSLERDGNTINVTAIGDGQVWYVVNIPLMELKLDRVMALDDWPRTVRQALEKGAKYNAV
jgi:hypothetical protein